jgi:hypothetical protein
MDVKPRYRHRAVAHELHYSERFGPGLPESGSERVPQAVRGEVARQLHVRSHSAVLLVDRGRKQRSTVCGGTTRGRSRRARAPSASPARARTAACSGPSNSLPNCSLGDDAQLVLEQPAYFEGVDCDDVGVFAGYQLTHVDVEDQDGLIDLTRLAGVIATVRTLADLEKTAAAKADIGSWLNL